MVSNIFFSFTPKIGKMIQFDYNISSDGWGNQPPNQFRKSQGIFVPVIFFREKNDPNNRPSSMDPNDALNCGWMVLGLKAMENFENLAHGRILAMEHSFQNLHPQKLTWNLEMMVSNRNLLSKGPFSGSMFVLGGVGCKILGENVLRSNGT